jgi:hypothetical protein|tara:strand:- start:64 stop:396 length:333 start_codon:yes stop_codon:yes gene_type:complete
MIIFNWKIEEIEWVNRVDGLAKVVSSVKGIFEGTQEDHTCHLPFSATLSSPQNDTYIEYNELTQEQVTQWVVSSLGVEEISSMKTIITTLLEEDLGGGQTHKHTSSLPWG